MAYTIRMMLNIGVRIRIYSWVLNLFLKKNSVMKRNSKNRKEFTRVKTEKFHKAHDDKDNLVDILFN